MIPCLRLLFAAALFGGVSVPPGASASTFDDHFDGDSGGCPSSWGGLGAGSVVEAGTTVTLHDEYVIYTNDDFDADQPGATVVTVTVAGTTHHTSGGLVDFAQLDNHFWVKLWAQDGRIEIKASDTANGEEEYVAGWVPGYAGGPTRLTYTLEADSFRVATDDPPSSFGPVAYADVFTSFTRADLGHVAKLVIDNECAPDNPPCSSEYDRITLDTGQSTAVRPSGFGRTKALYR